MKVNTVSISLLLDNGKWATMPTTRIPNIDMAYAVAHRGPGRRVGQINPRSRRPRGEEGVNL